MSPAIAVIVPFFNASDTLPQLVEALKAQSYPNFIALFVDDGSTDSGHAYMDGIATTDSRFRVLTGSHAGPGPARNIGLDEAEKSGVEYVTFIDADDLPLPTMLAEAKETLETSGADIAHYQWSSTVGGTPHKDSTKGTPSIYVWNKLYRRSAIGDIRFIATKFAEDLAFFLETEVRSPKRIAIDKPLYVHFTRAGSLWETRTPNDIADVTEQVITLIAQFVQKHHESDIAHSWYSVYLPSLLKRWRKSIRKLPREKRTIATRFYLSRLRQLRTANGLPALFPSRRYILEGIKNRLLLFFLPCVESGQRLFGKWRSSLFEFRCRQVLSRIRQKKRLGKPISVVFIITDVSKWKTRKLFEAMVGSSHFHPVIAVSVDQAVTRLPCTERKAQFRKRLEWFRNQGIPTEAAYDATANNACDLRTLHPDIIFYQQPWQILRKHTPKRISKFALPVYVPYSVTTFGNVDIECKLPFFEWIFAQFVQSRAWARIYRDSIAESDICCRQVATGNPVMDEIVAEVMHTKRHDAIIYAPHWTVRTPGKADLYPYGTFHGNGREILAYAKCHPEMRWVFKPHPLLRGALVERGLMTKSEVNEYYAEWEKIAEVCYDSNYSRLFAESKALITDCGSFLVEYSATGNPVVRLRPTDSKIKALPPNRHLLSTYYEVSDLDSMYAAFDKILCHGEDILKDERKSAITDEGLNSGCATARIMEYLNRITSERMG